MSRFEDMTPDEREEMQAEFEHEDTTEERRIEILKLLQEAANEACIGPKCFNCGNYPFLAIYEKGLIEGHVYSREGLSEVSISRCCEFCFDSITLVEEEDEDDYRAEKDAELARDEES